MKSVAFTNKYKKDARLMDRRRKDRNKISAIIDLLASELPLPLKCRPHKLSSNYDGLWECHIEPDWLLIYDITETEIILYRTGTHSDLFD